MASPLPSHRPMGVQSRLRCGARTPFSPVDAATTKLPLTAMPASGSHLHPHPGKRVARFDGSIDYDSHSSIGVESRPPWRGSSSGARDIQLSNGPMINAALTMARSSWVGASPQRDLPQGCGGYSARSRAASPAVSFP
ncbi:hypothetical protein VDGL01_02305 [Verticillium dahliae]